MKVLVPYQGDDSDVQIRPIQSMDATVLVVGEEDFLTTLVERIEELQRYSIQFADHLQAAMARIQAQPPALLLCQASLPGSLDLCYQLKEQSQWAGIYCLLLDDQPHYLSAEAEVERVAQALETGADAYLWMTAPEQTRDRATIAQQNRLIQAQIQAGLRWVKSHQELMQTNDILSAIALSDPLTELSNRRALEWDLPRQIQNARTRSSPLCLLMLDVDYFKSINDTYGHLVGDRVLQMLSARLQHNLRFYDTPFRYGGEEFVILLSNTKSEEATYIADRLRRLIGEQPFTVNETLDLSITISGGIADLKPEDDAQGVSLLDRADQNLLRAKAAGRNCVINSLVSEAQECSQEL